MIWNNIVCIANKSTIKRQMMGKSGYSAINVKDGFILIVLK